MPVELFCIVTDFVPRGFFRDELVKLIPQTELTVESICRNREAICLRKDFTQRGAADSAKATAVLVRGSWFEELDVIPSLNPSQGFFLDEYEGARANLSASRAMTGPHHRWFSR